MKTLILIFLSFFLSKSCIGQTSLDNTIIEYTANTRGFYQKIVIQNHQIIIHKDRQANDNPLIEKINPKLWNKIVQEFQKIDLNKIKTYQGETQKRFYDGAAHANLKIKNDGKIYESQTFDHGTPPLQLKKLIKIIFTLIPPE